MTHTIFLPRYPWHTQIFCHDTRDTQNFWHGTRGTHITFFHGTRGTQTFSVTVPMAHTIFCHVTRGTKKNSVMVLVAHTIFLNFVSDKRTDWVWWEAKCARLLTSNAFFVSSLDVVDSTATSLWSGPPKYCGSISRNKFFSSPKGYKPPLGRSQVPIRGVLRLFPPGGLC